MANPSSALGERAHFLKAWGLNWAKITQELGFPNREATQLAAREWALQTGAEWPPREAGVLQRNEANRQSRVAAALQLTSPVGAAPRPTPKADGLGNKGKQVYSARAGGASWTEAARVAGSTSASTAIGTARGFAQTNGLPWPPLGRATSEAVIRPSSPALVAATAAKVAELRHAEASASSKVWATKGAEGYRLRESGLSWQKIGKRLGYTSSQPAWSGARRFAQYTQSPWPPVVALDADAGQPESVGQGATLRPDSSPTIGQNASPTKGELAYLARAAFATWDQAAVASGTTSADNARTVAKAYAFSQRLPWPPPVAPVPPKPTPVRVRQAENAKRGYELRASGMGWFDIARELQVNSWDTTLRLVRRYADRTGLPWPVPVVREAAAVATQGRGSTAEAQILLLTSDMRGPVAAPYRGIGDVRSQLTGPAVQPGIGTLQAVLDAKQAENQAIGQGGMSAHQRPVPPDLATAAAVPATPIVPPPPETDVQPTVSSNTDKVRTVVKTSPAPTPAVTPSATAKVRMVVNADHAAVDIDDASQTPQWSAFYACAALALVDGDGWIGPEVVASLGPWRHKKPASIGKEVARHLANAAILEHRGKTQRWRINLPLNEIQFMPDVAAVQRWIGEPSATPTEGVRPSSRLSVGTISDVVRAALSPADPPKPLDTAFQPATAYAALLAAKWAYRDRDHESLAAASQQWVEARDPIGRAVGARIASMEVLIAPESQPEQALLSLRRLAARLESSADVGSLAVVMHAMGILSLRAGLFEASVAHLDRALCFAGVANDYTTMYQICWQRALAAEALARSTPSPALPPEILDLVSVCFELDDRYQIDPTSIRSECAAARWAVELGQFDRASAFLDRAARRWSAEITILDEAQFYRTRAALAHHSGGEPGLVRSDLERAAERYDLLGNEADAAAMRAMAAQTKSTRKQGKRAP